MAGVGSIPILSYGDEEVQQEHPADTITAQSSATTINQAAERSQKVSVILASNLSTKHQPFTDGQFKSPHVLQSTHTTDAQPAKKGKQRTNAKTSQANGSKSGSTSSRKPSTDDDIHNDVDQAIDQGLDPKVAREAVIEAKRRRAAYKAMMVLYEQGATDADALAQIAAPMSGQELQQVAYERSIAGRCGSPLCNKSVSAKQAQHIRWTASGDIIDRDSGPVYCDAACQQFVTQFAELLGDPMQRLKPGEREKLLVSHWPKHDGKEVAAQVNGVTTMLAEVQERNISSSGATLVNSAENQPLAGSSAAVEGYIPKSVKQQQQEIPPAYSISVPKPQEAVAGVQTYQPMGAAPVQAASAAPATQHNLSGVARHITSLVDDISVPTTAATTKPEIASQPVASQTISETASNVTATDDDNCVMSNTATSNAVQADKPSSLDEQNLSNDDGPWDDLTADLQEFDAWMQKIPWETPGQSMQWTDGVDEDELAKIHAAAARAQSQQPAKSSLRKPANSSPAKKTVKWADESKQEFTDRAEPVPEKPVLVFTLEGAGSDMQGTLLPQSDTAGLKDNSDPGKQLAGTLEVQDAVKLREFMGEKLDSLTQIASEPGPEGLTESTSSELPPTAGLPKGFQLWFPPSAGGIGVSLPKGAPHTSHQPSKTAPNSKAKPKFKPRVPSGMTSTKTSNASDAGNVNTSANTTTLETGRTQPTSCKQPAGDQAACLELAASSSGTNGSSLATSIVSESKQKRAPQTLSLRPRQQRVVLLDSVPKPEASSKPSIIVTRTQHSNGSASNAGRIQAAAAPTTTTTDLQPTAEVLPFEQPDSRSADRKLSRPPGNGVWVIKSDPEHAKPLNQRKVQYDNWQTGEDELDEDSGLSDNEPYHVQDRKQHGIHGRHSTAQHDEAIDSDSNDDSNYDAASDQDVESGSDEEQGRTRRKQGQNPDKKAMNKTVLYEEDDEAADEEVEMEDLKALLSEIQGAGKIQGDEDEGGGSDDDDPAYASAFPFFGPPPAGYRVELSPYNLLWSLLSTWITRETLVYLNAAAAGVPNVVQPSTADSQAAESLLNALPAPDVREIHARAAFAELLSPHLESTVVDLKAQVYLGDINKRLSGLLRTFTFPGPVPSLSIQQWRLLALAILRALSMFRLPGLAIVFDDPSAKGSATLSNLLEGTGFELPHLSALVDLLLND